MPLIDSDHGIVLADLNPDKRLCQHSLCAAYGKHKACGKCKYARYCSAECQKLDWPDHKHTCGKFETPIMDAAGWRRMYKGVWEWAAAEGLEAHSTPHKIHTHCLLVDVVWGDRLVGSTPSYFELMSVRVDPIAELGPVTDAMSAALDRDAEICRKIQEEGGLGQARVVFHFRESPRYAGRYPRDIYIVEKYALRDKPDPNHDAPDSWMDVEGWVKRLTNSIAMLKTMDKWSARLHGPPPERPEGLLYASFKY
ncbi:hypothetical protein BD311DRAFT_717252 [Dichomitus squalens]|uniref:MYND-type domain-containing protein n=1 Tax=Dichomitus squalens TaxID=114155 RepID=A0A4Q9MTT2_9APHY|nr:hypothetical protein BD311DRAFT_717252 [Dichomitus squalens]